MDKYYILIRKHWASLFILFYTLFIIYATTIPFNMVSSREELADRVRKINLVPFMDKGEHASGADMLANLIFFIPLGIGLGARRITMNYRRFTAKDWWQIAATAAALSFLAESLQFFSDRRYPSINDLMMNTAGAIAGTLLVYVVYLKYRQSIKNILITAFQGKPEFVIAATLIGLIIFIESFPFTYQLYLESLAERAHLFYTRPVFSYNYFVDFLLYLMYYSLPGAFFMTGLKRYNSLFTKRRVWPVILFLFFIPVLIEIYQWLLPHRLLSITDILFAESGILTGSIIALIPARSKSISSNRPLYFFSMVYLLFLAYYLASSGEGLGDWFGTLASHSPRLIKLERLFWISLLKDVFTFAPAGFVVNFIWNHKLRKHLPAVARNFILAGLVLSGVIRVSPGEEILMTATRLAAIGLALWSGNISWHVYHDLMMRGES